MNVYTFESHPPPLPEIFWENKLREGGILDVCLYIWIPPPCQWNWSKIPASLMQVTQARLVRGKGLFILRCGLRRWPICTHLRHIMGVFAFNPLPALLKMIKKWHKSCKKRLEKKFDRRIWGRGGLLMYVFTFESDRPPCLKNFDRIIWGKGVFLMYVYIFIFIYMKIVKLVKNSCKPNASHTSQSC